MLFFVGVVIVFASVLGGYTALGGHLQVLVQPFELLIIGGSAVGAFVIATPLPVVIKSMKSLGLLLRGARYNKEAYVELLSVLYAIFRLGQSKGNVALEPHFENPFESAIIAHFPKFRGNHTAVIFLCDYLRLMTLGTKNPHEVEAIMDEELETHEREHKHITGALTNMAESLPALGIVAAVLGVIKTMGAINEPPEKLGGLIGAALVGTFLGVLLSYGFVGPIARQLQAIFDEEKHYLQCIRGVLLASLQGYPPAIAIEFGRKMLESGVRPRFDEVEQAVGQVPKF
ncbi:MAG: flagellar motor stator protein MotA [Proteobacteria bacterium]|nr:flagellar motor stator protein MotA [Pseudomonadota bacterium]